MKRMTIHTMNYPMPIIRPQSFAQRATKEGDLWEIWSPKPGGEEGFFIPVFMGSEEEMVATLKEGGKVERNGQNRYDITEAF